MSKRKHMPTAEAFRNLARWMRERLPAGQIFIMPVCHKCVAGAIGGILMTDAEARGDTSLPDSQDRRERYAFRLGMNKTAQMLGFSTDRELEDWAAEHPYLWGNAYGSLLFGTHIAAWKPDAFEKTADGKLIMPVEIGGPEVSRVRMVSLEDVLAHLDGVASRLDQRERFVRGFDFTKWLEPQEPETPPVFTEPDIAA